MIFGTSIKCVSLKIAVLRFSFQVCRWFSLAGLEWVANILLQELHEARDIATSVQSSVFNLSIMVATWVGGLLLIYFPASGVKLIVYLSLACFILGIGIAFLAKRTLGSSSAPSTNP